MGFLFTGLNYKIKEYCMGAIVSVQNLNLSIVYNVGAGNFTVTCPSFSYTPILSGGETSLTATVNVRDRTVSPNNSSYFTRWQSGLITQPYSRVHTSTQIGFVNSLSGTITKALMYSYLTNNNYVWYMDWYSYISSTPNSCGTRFGTFIGLPNATQEAAHDEVRDPSAPSSSFINVTNNFTPIADATVLSGSYNACANSLSWTQALNTDGYKIYKSINGGAYSLLTTVVGLANTTYDDTAVTVGNTYAYKIETYNSVWFEDAYTRKSNIISGTISTPNPTLTSVVGTECTKTNVISWTDSFTCETGYRLLRSTGGAYTQIASLSPSITSYIDNTVVFNQIYNYKLAIDLPSGSFTGSTAVSNNISFSAPTLLTANKDYASNLKIDWNLNTLCESNVSLERKAGSGGTWQVIATLPAGTETYLDYNIINNIVYYYRVRVYNSLTNQYSAYSNEGQIFYNPFFINQGANADIHTIAIDDENQPYIGGAFTTYFTPSTSANRIAGLKVIGRVNTGFTYGTGFNNEVWKVLYDTANDKFYVGGSFTSYNGTAANGIVRLNADGTVDTGFVYGTGFNGVVYDMAFDNNGKIYCTGTFGTYQGTAASRIIRLNTDGTIDTGFVYGTGLLPQTSETIAGSVVVVDPATNSVFVGGSFYSYRDGVSSRSLVKILENGTKDSAFSCEAITGWPSNDGIQGNVLTLLIDSSNLYFGGEFTSVGDDFSGRYLCERLASVNKNTGIVNSVFTSQTSFNAATIDIKLDPVDNTKLYVTGAFTNFNRIVKISKTTAAIDSTFTTNAGSGFNNTARKMVFDNNNSLFVVGNFTSYNGYAVNRIIKLDSDGNNDQTYNTDTNNETTIISVEGVASNQVTLNWVTTLADPITGNTIYRRKLSNLTFDLMASVASGVTSYTITETVDDDFEYKVRANRVVGASESLPLTLPLNNFVPTVSRSVEGSLTLNWTNSSTYVTNDVIYRSTNPTGYTIINTIAPNTTYVDSSLNENTIYYYKFKYLNGSNVTSYFNDPVTGLTYLASPSLTSIVQPFNGVKSFIISWDNNSAYSTSFEIFRRALSGGGFSSVGTTTGTSFLDTTVTTFGETYEYYVIALSAGNESAPSNTFDRILENVTMILDYRTSYQDNLVTRDTYLFWTLFGSCTGNTYTVYKSYDGINYTTLTTTTATTYTDTETFTACQECTSVYYYVTIQCIGLIISNVVNPVVEPPKNKWNMGGLSRLWIGRSNGNITYDVVNATYATLDYYGNNIMTLTNINGVGTWYELPVSTTAKYSQKMVIDKQGYTFSEILELEIPKLNPAKWLTISDILDDDLVIAFQTNNGDYCIMGYDAPAKILVYNATTEDSKYNFTVEVRGNYNLMKFLDKTYVQNFIL